MRYDVIVVGSGPAGVTAALRARELGARVALVERGRPGGTCTLDGCVPTRVLAHTARLLRDAAQFAGYGLQAERPTVDFARVMARTQQVVYQVQEKKQLLAHLEDVGAVAFSGVGNAYFLDPHRLGLADGTTLEGDRFILCAGGSARRLDFPGAEYAATHSDVWMFDRLPASVIVVGGGATGCQLASIFAAFGSQVTLMDVAPRLLVTEDALVASTLMAEFGKRGIDVITGISALKSIELRDGLRYLSYEKDGQALTRPAEAVVLAVGWPGNLRELHLEAAGVATTGAYVQVDDYLQTSVPHIFAAGDITGKMMLVQSASHQARVAAENAVLGPQRKAEHRLVPHGGFTDPEYASVGLTEEQARASLGSERCVVAVVPYADMDRAVIDGHTVGFGKLLVDRETRYVVGAHVVGELAVEIVELVAAGMAAGMRVEQLADLEIAYPTYTAIVGLAARQIVRELGVVPVAPEWRALKQVRGAEWERREY
jgi:pyruvate/2-oxoglutarate dehydrogenase complex dihydrolipoamide dehydrogenase (E3) component